MVCPSLRLFVRLCVCQMVYQSWPLAGPRTLFFFLLRRKDDSAWNTISEFVVASAKSVARQTTSGYAGQTAAKIETLNAIDLESLPRFSSTFKELDRVLGGGIVPGAAMLIGGSPGAGKSTLLLQVMCQMAKSETALYVTGEESLQQVAMRAKRLNLPDDKLMMLAETNVETICDLALTKKPKIMVIDSIQVMHVSDVQSAPCSVSQVRESAAYLTRFAKQNHIAMFIVGHVTKDGNLAGPKVLEHCIDSSMMLEGESDGRYRTLRSHKNRFGAVNELGVFADGVRVGSIPKRPSSSSMKSSGRAGREEAPWPLRRSRDDVHVEGCHPPPSS